MPVRVALNHKTVYRYDRPVTLSPQVVRLRPAPHSRTPVPAYSLKVEPAGHFLNWQQDAYGNYLARLVFAKPVREFSVEVDLIADMTTVNPFDFFVEPAAETFPFTYEPELAKELAPYLEMQPAGPRLANVVAAHKSGKRATNDFLVAVNQDLWKRIKYTVRLEPGIQTPEETLTLASGSCRDSAWLMVQLLRHLGLAARFASGYLIQLTADEKPVEGPSGPEKDFTDLHAWAEVYLPGAGWVGLDATSGLLCGEGHIPLACTADPSSAAPITGNFAFTPDPKLPDEVDVKFDFHMSVARVHEDPRVTKPYTPGQWNEIDRLGDAVDAALAAGDVRLTMGGEPTFVAIDDRDADEWNTAALGDVKRARAGELLRRLHDRFAPGGLLHFGQGKWYPGEPLPRWALGCFWRADGEPVWRNPSLVASDTHDYNVTPETARAFAAALAGKLGVNPSHAVPGYEDAVYYLWREQTLPLNVDPLESKLDDALERDRLAKLFGRGLKQAVGYVLPLRRSAGGWESGEWTLRRGHLFLLPGDSPMGYRLPLDSLPWEKPEDRQKVHEVDPSIPRSALPPRPDYSGR